MSTARTRNSFLHIHFVNLLSCPLGGGPDSPSDEGATVFGAAEVLAIADLQFPILLDKSVDENRIVAECGPSGGGDYACGLRCD